MRAVCAVCVCTSLCTHLEQLLSDLGEVAALDVVVRLEEDFAEPGLAEGIILEVESIEALERVAIRLRGALDTPAAITCT